VREEQGIYDFDGKAEEKRPLGKENIKMDEVLWIGLIWFRTGTSGGLL
jgi:hypothetical protein